MTSFSNETENFLPPISITHDSEILETTRQRAVEYQLMLDEFEGEIDDKVALSAEIVDELDLTCGHIGLEMCVTGLVRARQAKFAYVDPETQTLPAEAILEGDAPVEELAVQSVGYFAMNDSEKLQLYHDAITLPSEYISIPNTGHILRQDYIFMPVDKGTYHITIAGEPTIENTIEQLEYYAPHIMEKIDEAVLNTDDSTRIIRNLGKVDLTSINTRARDTIMQLIEDYTNDIVAFPHKLTHSVSGFRELFVHNEDGSLGYGEVGTGVKMTGTIEKISITHDNRFGIKMLLPFSDDSQRLVEIPLAPRMFLKKFDLFTIE